MVFKYFSKCEVETLIPLGVTSVCLLATISDAPELSEGVLSLASQLTPHFDRVIIITNPRHISFVPRKCVIAPFIESDVGRDFGMWARALKFLPPYVERLGLVNDSCHVVNFLDPCFRKAASSAWPVWGLTMSNEFHQHIQSYFFVAERRVVPDVVVFFHSKTFSEDAHKSKLELIHDCEIGLSRYLVEKGHTLHAVYTKDMCDAFVPITQSNTIYPTSENVAYSRWDALLIMQCPLLKKKRAHLPSGDILMELFTPFIKS